MLSPGDTDGDGDVDGTDLATLGLNWDPAGTDARWSDGDFDGDGDVDGTDLAAIGLNWNPAGAAIPEPTSLALVAIGCLAMLKRRHR